MAKPQRDGTYYGETVRDDEDPKVTWQWKGDRWDRVNTPPPALR